jgi:ATP-dependent Lon protease
MTARPAAGSAPLPEVLPVLPLRDGPVLPFITAPLTVLGERQVAAVDEALAGERRLLLLGVRDPSVEEPGEKQLERVGVVAVIHRLLKLPDGRLRILVQGQARARAVRFVGGGSALRARLELLSEPKSRRPGVGARALLRHLREGLERLAALGKPISPEVMAIAVAVEEPGRLADLVASNLDLSREAAQELVEAVDPAVRLERVRTQLDAELRELALQQEMAERARGEADRGHREFLLRHQIRAIQKELGEGEDVSEEIAGYRRAAEQKGMSGEAREELERQLRRLERGNPDSAETSVVRTYLDWLTGLPWSTASADDLDLARARRILDEDHFDLEKIKERLVEFLAVRRLNPDAHGPILCLVGPPGVGKTSLGRSVARALGRRFVRISLGGVRDEAEIRGHRRTYVGALPGRILQGLHQAGTSNPVFMLDEIDKVGADLRGDPTAALLEALDPEQNGTFRDHYLGVPYDLSRVLFLSTANVIDPIHPAFLDRMELLRLPGYALEEKVAIAERHLVPQELARHGLSTRDLALPRRTLRALAADYTREAGVRELGRRIAALCRKTARAKVEGRPTPPRLEPERVADRLGPPPFPHEALLPEDRVGVAAGLAWTAAGGELLFVEALATPGDGKLRLTGQLGEVMRESAQAALTLVRAATAETAGCADFFSGRDLHVHVPGGATPKDGPSAGLTLGIALLSLATGRPVRRRLAMTGEVTLRGDLLPVGGIREKVLAARAAGAAAVILPAANRNDVAEIPAAQRRGIAFHFVSRFAEVPPLALVTAGPRERPAAPRRVARPRRTTGRGTK